MEEKMALLNAVPGKTYVVKGINTQDEEMKKDLIEMVRKMQNTLNYVNEVLEKRTPFRLSQIKVVLEFL